MKKITGIMIITWIALAISVSAVNWTAYDMADYGTTASITNTETIDTKTFTEVLITYDAATTNTLAVYLTKDSISYRLGTTSVTNAQYDYLDLTDIQSGEGDVLTITTTDTNVNVFVRSQ